MHIGFFGAGKKLEATMQAYVSMIHVAAVPRERKPRAEPHREFW
jgi:hypothetical protein